MSAVEKYNDNNAMIIALRKGDIDAYNYIYDTYFARLVNYSKRIIFSEIVAQDIVQEAYVKLWENRDKFTISPIAYLYRAVYNSSINSITHKKVIETYEKLHLEKIYYQNVVQRPDSELKIVDKDLERLFLEAKANLPPRCREIFEMRRNEGLTIREIADKLGLSEKSVENQMTIAIKKLVSQLSDVLDNIYILTQIFGG